MGWAVGAGLARRNGTVAGAASVISWNTMAVAAAASRGEVELPMLATEETMAGASGADHASWADQRTGTGR